MVQAADLAMYAAKTAGKGRYRTFDPAMLTGAVERRTLERDLKRAVERDEIELHYQPVVDLVTAARAASRRSPAGRTRNAAASRRTSSSRWRSRPA